METQIIRNAADLNVCISRLLKLDLNKVWHVVVKMDMHNRNACQNRLYWAWMASLSKQIHIQTGKPVKKDHVHELFCRLYLPSDTITLGGMDLDVRPKTSHLSVKAFAEYLTQVEAYVLASGIYELPAHDATYREAFGIKGDWND